MNPSDPTNPIQDPSPPENGQYDFIMAPSKLEKPRGIKGVASGNSFIKKLLVIIGGAVVGMLVLGFVINLIFGSKTNLEDLVKLSQSQTEIIRLSDMGNKTGSQGGRVAAINTLLTVSNQRNELLAYMKKNGRTVEKKELNLGKDKTSDTLLQKGKQTSTFDTVYTTLLRKQMTDYVAEIKTAYNHAPGKVQRALLDAQYKEADRLLKQWP